MRKQLVAALLLTAVTSTALAATVRYTNASVQFNGSVNSDYLGKLAVATPVTVLQKKGKTVKVKVEGWALSEYPGQIFSAPGVRIEYGSFDEEKAVKLNPAGGKQVVQGNEWVQASVEGWVDAAKLTGDIKGLWAQGKQRLGDACSTCHGAPTADHFTANQWASQLPLRGGRAGHSRAGNNALMFKYLQEHAKK